MQVSQLNPVQYQQVLIACHNAVESLKSTAAGWKDDYLWFGQQKYKRFATCPYLYTKQRSYQRIVDYGKRFEDVAIRHRFATNVWLDLDTIKALGFRFKRSNRLRSVEMTFATVADRSTKTTRKLYNASQLSNFPHKKLKRYNQYTDINDQADRWVSRLPVKVIHGTFGPVYECSSNAIYMIDRDRYVNCKSYYHDLFHEIGHWSGNKSNLRRIDVNNQLEFDIRSCRYAHEEIVAELIAVKLLTFFGIDVDFDASSVYIDGYLSYFDDTDNAVCTFERADEDSDQAVLFLLTNYFNIE